MREEIRWRSSWFGYLVGAIPVAAFAFIFVNACIGGWYGDAALYGVLMVALFVGLVWRPALILTETELRAVNPVTWWTVPLRDIVDVGGGYGGLEVVTRQGKRRTAWVVQQTNLPGPTRGRSDRIVAQIRERVAEVERDQQGPPKP